MRPGPSPRLLTACVALAAPLVALAPLLPWQAALSAFCTNLHSRPSATNSARKRRDGTLRHFIRDSSSSSSSITRLIQGVQTRRVHPAHASSTAVAARADATSVEVDWRSAKQTDPQHRWDFWQALPIAPYDRRVTMRQEAIPGEMWTFEQKQGILYIHVPIRMTVYRMTSRRGLFVYAPVAPTDECIGLLRELEEQYGEVAHIVLPTVAVEHKVFVGPFARACPKAEVWVCPGQFSVPLQLPLEFLGFPSGRLHILENSGVGGKVALPEEWQREGIDFRILGPIGKDVANGAFAEVVLYLRRLRTMLVTDLVVSVNAEPPPIIAEDPRTLVFHARDGPLSDIDATPQALIRGWRRIALFALFFQSSAIEAQTVNEAFRDALQSKAKDLGWGGLLPWNFRDQWEASFDSLRGGRNGPGGLLVAPILSELILNRFLRSDVWPFVEDVASSWSDMERVVPAHFEAPVRAGANDWRDAFRRRFGEPPGSRGFLQDLFGVPPGPEPLVADLEYLRNVSSFLTAAGVIDPPEKL